jgi:hypothetical protein
MLCLKISTAASLSEDSTHKRFLTFLLIQFLFAEWMEKKYTIFGFLTTDTISIVQRDLVG